jgi:hypothetical protein
LTWEQPIDAQALGIPLASQVAGQSLEAIVTSQVAGRDDGQLCSACHSKDDPQGGYGIDVALNGRLASLDPWVNVGTVTQRTWAGPSGWAVRFINNKTKPASLKAAMQAWVDGGCKDEDHAVLPRRD